MRKKLTDQAGMTLLEVMFASGVLAMGLSMLFGALISINVVGELSESRAQATAELSGILEELRFMSRNDVLAYVAPELTQPGTYQAVTLETYDAEGTALSLPLDPGIDAEDLPVPLEVKATLIWQDESGHVFSVFATTQCGT